MSEEGVFKDKDGTSLQLRVLVNSENSFRAASAEIIVEDLEKMGVEVTLVSLKGKEYKAALTRGDFDVFLGGYQFDEQMDMRLLLTNVEDNYIGYSNDKVYDMLYEMHSGASPQD